jgi:hypothetical protein
MELNPIPSKVLDAFCWGWQGIVNANKEFYSLFLDQGKLTLAGAASVNLSCFWTLSMGESESGICRRSQQFPNNH